MNKKDHEAVSRYLGTSEDYEIRVILGENAKMPNKAHPDDAGFDLYAVEDVRIYPGEVKKVPLNIKMALPPGTWANVTGKSGLGSKGLLVYAGVIDAGYRGVVHVVMTNVKLRLENGQPNTEPIVVLKGEKLAQLIMSPYKNTYFMTQVSELDSTSRGEGGFGSSGK